MPGVCGVLGCHRPPAVPAAGGEPDGQAAAAGRLETQRARGFQRERWLNRHALPGAGRGAPAAEGQQALPCEADPRSACHHPAAQPAALLHPHRCERGLQERRSAHAVSRATELSTLSTKRSVGALGSGGGLPRVHGVAAALALQLSCSCTREQERLGSAPSRACCT